MTSDMLRERIVGNQVVITSVISEHTLSESSPGSYVGEKMVQGEGTVLRVSEAGGGFPLLVIEDSQGAIRTLVFALGWELSLTADSA